MISFNVEFALHVDSAIADAEPYPVVVLGGDMNDVAVGQIARENGYARPTQHGPATTRLGRLDHIFLKGLSVPDRGASGTVLDVGGASDHLPVGAVGILRCSPSKQGDKLC